MHFFKSSFQRRLHRSRCKLGLDVKHSRHVRQIHLAYIEGVLQHSKYSVFIDKSLGSSLTVWCTQKAQSGRSPAYLGGPPAILDPPLALQLNLNDTYKIEVPK